MDLLKVAFSLIALQLISPVTSDYGNHQEPKSGEFCDISAQVSCRVNDGTKRRCGALKDTPYEDCGEVDLTWTYRYCNLNTNGKVVLRPMLTIPLLHTMDISDISNDSFDKSNMKVGECRQYPIRKIVDSCESHTTVASLKVEGNVAGMRNIDGYFCYAFDWMQQRIGVPPPEPTPEPVFIGVPGPTIDLSLTCMYKDAGGYGFDTGCHKIQDYIPTKKSECLLPVEYTYKVQSLSSNHTRLQAIVDEDTDNLVEVTKLDPVGEFVRTVYKTINVCKRNAGKVIKKGLAVATNLDGTLSSFDKEEIVVKMPELVSKFRVSEFQCFYKGVLCEEIVRRSEDACFSGEVLYKYEVENIGLVCNSIAHVGVKFGMDGEYSALVLGERSCAGGKRSCPGDFWIFSEKRFVDTCKTEVVPITAEVEVGPPTDPYADHLDGDDDDENGNKKPSVITTTTTIVSTTTTTTTTTATSYWKITGGPADPGWNVKHDANTFAQTAQPTISLSLSPTAEPSEAPDVVGMCTTTATELVFKFYGNNCHGRRRKRKLRSLRSGKGSGSVSVAGTNTGSGAGWCTDHKTITYPAEIEVISGNHQKTYAARTSYALNDEIIVQDDQGLTLNHNVLSKVYTHSGDLAQEVTFHTEFDCLEMSVNKRFGSLTLIRFQP